jgi:hypothetical protein
MTDPIEDAIIADRLASGGRLLRHKALLDIWQDLPAEELLADLLILAQIAAYRAHREHILAEARLLHAHGATHDCSEWPADGRCAVCDRML